MKKVVSLIGDFIKGGFYFGRGFSDMVTRKLEVPYPKSKIAGGVLDAAAGVGISWLTLSNFIYLGLTTVAAAAAITSAPLTAVGTLAVNIVFTALNLGMAGIGLGLLDACRDKCGIPPLSLPKIKMPSFRKSGPAAAEPKSTFKSDRKIFVAFNNKADEQQPAESPAKKPAPAPKYTPGPRL
jgi:hypothetical protein